MTDPILISPGDAIEENRLVESVARAPTNPSFVSYYPPTGHLLCEQYLGCKLEDVTTGFLHRNNRRQKFGLRHKIASDLVHVPDWLDLTNLRAEDSPLSLSGPKAFVENEAAFIPWKYNTETLEDIANQVKFALSGVPRDKVDEVAERCAQELAWLGSIKRDRALGSYAARCPKAFKLYSQLLTASAEGDPVISSQPGGRRRKSDLQKLAEDLGLGEHGVDVILANRPKLEEGLINLALHANDKHPEEFHRELIDFVQKDILSLRTEAQLDKAAADESPAWVQIRDVLAEIEADKDFMEHEAKKSPLPSFQFILGGPASVYKIGDGHCVTLGNIWWPVGLTTDQEFDEFMSWAGKKGWDRGDTFRGMPKVSDDSSSNFKTAAQSWCRKTSTRNAQFEGHPWAFMMGEVMDDCISKNPTLQSKGYVGCYSFVIEGFDETTGEAIIKYQNGKPVMEKHMFSSHSRLQASQMPSPMNPYLCLELEAYGIPYPEEDSPEVASYYTSHGTPTPRIGVYIPREKDGVTYDNQRIWDMQPVQLTKAQLEKAYRDLGLIGDDVDPRMQAKQNAFIRQAPDRVTYTPAA